MANERIEALKLFFKQLLGTETFKSAELKISEKQVGGTVEVINEDGTLSPVEDGEYKDADGTPFKVEAGVIIEWNGEKEAEKAEEKPAEEAMEETKEEVPAEPSEVEALKAELDALKSETESLKAIVEELKGSIAAEQAMNEQFSKGIADLNATLKVIAELPAEFSKTNSSNTVKDANKERQKNIKAMFGL
jgi:chromosome segregation ATPase